MRPILPFLCWFVLQLSAARLLADEAEAVQHFEQHVLPIFQAHCYQCHAGGEAKGGMRLDTRARLLRGGESGTVVDLDQPAESLLLAAIRYEGPEMPPRGPLQQAQLDAVGVWIEAGAPYPASMLGSDEADDIEQSASLATAAPHGRQITDVDRGFWAFQPIASPSAASTGDPMAGGPIDAWISTRLEEDGIVANRAADPAHLLRRLHYDLTGLPPTLDEIREFEADPSEVRYRQWVDRLLASPRYGERWGRHWLDLVRYAETNSYERDGDKPEVWRFRDFVVESFNSDKPYDQFAREQLAGDEIGAGSEGLIATGYYRLGIWDDEPVDAEQALYDDLDDIVSTTGQVFLGLTLGCARCHDHKIDPLTQVDYYRFLAFFNGLNRYGVRSNESVREFSLRSIESARPSAANQQYQQHRDSLVGSMRQIESLVIEDLEPVEHEEFRHEVHRIPIMSKRVGRLLTEQQLADYRRWREELVELERNKPIAFAEALCVTEVGAAARPTHVLARGNPASPGDEVVPGGPEVLGGWTPEIPAIEGAATSGRRRILADWIASPANPLFARVIANRLWQYHFGQGLVRTPSDFGYQGARPSHPELLDYLASELISHGWQFKPLHRQIVLSNAYRRSSEPIEASLAKDPGNETYWRFGPRRLSAEEVHDTIWAVAGDLNLQMSGPSMFPELEPEVLAGQSRPGNGWKHSPVDQQARRAIYAKVKRSLRVPLLANYDVAEPDFSCPARFNTTTPAQALGMINSQFVHRTARRLAERVIAEVGDRPADRVRALLERTLRRTIQEAEVQRGVAFLEQLEAEQSLSAEQALEMFGLVALNLNELVYLD